MASAERSSALVWFLECRFIRLVPALCEFDSPIFVSKEGLATGLEEVVENGVVPVHGSLQECHGCS